MIRRVMTTAAIATLESLAFDNAALRELPVDLCEENIPRRVKGACFARVKPTPLSSPHTVVYSAQAMALLDLEESELKRDEFPSYFCGSKVISGADYAAHCYCGHQFGYFSGQLGDGATMYIGEVVNKKGERVEIQFKGAGKTPFSRTADGRKVLRSSLREFLCSEAMHHLGIPTTRAGSCITSPDTVVRDILYDGHPINEQCTVILRLAPTFLRFGSFEIFKTIDRTTERWGPSVGHDDILIQMLEYTLSFFYPEVPEGPLPERVVMLYEEIMNKTAALVAKWQAVGFCHGVLNTDNMSIIGYTIDYGPYGFMETYNPGFICNGSDSGGRYTYEKQPEICKWNVGKLGEMFAKVADKKKLDEVLQKWDEVYEQEYLQCMRSKLGLLTPHDGDKALISALFDTMFKTKADFTNVFVVLTENDITAPDNNVVTELLKHCLTLTEVISNTKYKHSKEECMNLLQIVNMYSSSGSNPLAMFGIEPQTLINDMDTHKQLEKYKAMTPDQKQQQDKDYWKKWLVKYKARLESDREKRKEIMRASNPVVVPRNHVLQRAIDKAERGDYSLTKRLLEVFEHPYTAPSESWMLGRDRANSCQTVT